MCEQCVGCSDKDYLRQLIAKYGNISNINPDSMLSAYEVREAITRVFHGNAQKELAWFGTEQKVGDFVKILDSF